MTHDFTTHYSTLVPNRECMAEVTKLLAPYLVEHTWTPGQVLWNEGDNEGKLILIKKGRIKIEHINPSGKPILLFIFGPGDLFGFLPFIDGSPYPATAITMETVTAQVMTRDRLHEILHENPELSIKLLTVLGVRLREALIKIQEFTGHDALARTAAALMTLLPPDARGDGLDIVEIPGPAYTFARELGITPETFSRALTRLEKAGIIHRLGSGHIQIMDPNVLGRAAAGYWSDR